mmetsp:Transcript_5286/g.19875  ORF Transcript_5286/g.19875 Transcript_5286/m.19875 type:complete len:309 (-) Transcript_5286:8564-9490(-)
MTTARVLAMGTSGDRSRSRRSHEPSPKKSAPACGRLGKAEHDPAGLGRLLLNLRDDEGADLGRVGHMRAAAGLQVHAVDLQHAHSTQAARRLHAHRTDQAGVGVQLVLADPAVRHRVRLGHQAVQAGLDRVLVERLIGVEVQPRVGLGDRAAVHRVGQQRAQQMGRGVKAPVGLAARGIDLDTHRGADGGRLAVQQVDDGAGLFLALAGVGHAPAPLAGDQPAGVARLAATERVADRAVQQHAALAMADHRGLALQQRGVLAEQFFGHHSLTWPWISGVTSPPIQVASWSRVTCTRPAQPSAAPCAAT